MPPFDRLASCLVSGGDWQIEPAARSHEALLARIRAKPFAELLANPNQFPEDGTMEQSSSLAVGKKPRQPIEGGPKPLADSRKSVKKRAAIIRAAIEIINAKSFALATMTEIAASLDLRDATLYYYFPSKKALAYACHVQSLERFETFIAEAAENASTGLEQLRGFIRRMLDDADANGQQFYFGDYSYLDADQRQTVGDWAARLSTRLERFIALGTADGSIVACESALVVNLVLGMLIWLAKWAPATRGLTVDRLMDAIGLVTFQGLEPRAAKRDSVSTTLGLRRKRKGRSS